VHVPVVALGPERLVAAAEINWAATRTGLLPAERFRPPPVHVKLTRDLRDGLGRPPVSRHRGPGDHSKGPELREIRDQLIGHPSASTPAVESAERLSSGNTARARIGSRNPPPTTGPASRPRLMRELLPPPAAPAVSHPR